MADLIPPLSSTPPGQPIHVFDRGRPRVFAHRGGSHLAPENTMAAFANADALGADGVEFDVHLARDGDVVIIHDATLERTTDGAGAVAHHTSEQLAGVDAAHRFTAIDGTPRFRGEGYGVPRFRDVLTRLPRLRCVVELKGSDPRVAHAAVDVARECGALPRVCFGGFSDAVVRAARARDAGVVSSAATEEARWALYRSWVGLAPKHPAYSGFQMPERYGAMRVVTPRWLWVMRRAGLVTQVWTVNEPRDMDRLFGWGVEALITDRPDLGVEAVARVVAERVRPRSTP